MRIAEFTLAQRYTQNLLQKQTSRVFSSRQKLTEENQGLAANIKLMNRWINILFWRTSTERTVCNAMSIPSVRHRFRCAHTLARLNLYYQNSIIQLITTTKNLNNELQFALNILIIKICLMVQ